MKHDLTRAAVAYLLDMWQPHKDRSIANTYCSLFLASWSSKLLCQPHGRFCFLSIHLIKHMKQTVHSKTTATKRLFELL